MATERPPSLRGSTTAEALRRSETDAETLAPVSAVLGALTRRDRRIVAESIRYEGYVLRQRREAERVKRAGALRIPAGLDYRALTGLSREIVEKLVAVRPETLGRAARIDGMTPPALALLAVHVARSGAERAG